MKFVLLVIVLSVVVASPANADAPPEHSLLKILVPDVAALRNIWDAGIDFEGVSGKPGGWMEFVATPREMLSLTERGIAFEVVETDLRAATVRGLSGAPTDALGFGPGSMGGYYTLDEVGAQLDSMTLLYPALIGQKQEIGYSIEGRPVWAVRISDNPGTDEPAEPELLYTSLTHAREPAGMMTLIYYMWWLLERYGTDQDATYLVNNRQIWFIPVVNPDGYAYNESTNPSGGGFWRKNRRNNGNGTWGVDLNRNYGPEHMWDAPNGGSSTSTGSDTYRGANPFSEPETQTIDTFMRLHRIRACLNYHTYSRLLIYPYGYLSAESGDSLIYREFAFDLVRANRYATGTDQQTVNYSTRGNSDDYMYGDTTKYRTYSLTPEVGTSFWPPSDQILPLALENLRANIHLSYVAGPMPVLSRHILSDSTASHGFRAGHPFAMQVGIRNKGLDTAHQLTVSFTTDSGTLHFVDASLFVSGLPPRGETLLPVSGVVDGTPVGGSRTLLFVRLTDGAGYDRTDTVTLYVGPPTEIFSDDAESGTPLWTAEGAWGVAASAHGGALSFHDSPAGVSAAWSNAGLQTAAPVNLTAYSAATLGFWTKWAIEPSYDFGMVRLSTDGGGSWTNLRTALTNEPSGAGVQAPGTAGYDAYTPGLDWVHQEADLTPFTGQPVLLRFEMATDGSDSRDGWYIDDIRITGYRAAIPGSAVSVASALPGGTGLFFGEAPGAGDGLDSALGESELGPVPPPGTFDVRWDIPGTNGGLTDIRNTLASAGDTNIFTLRINATASDYPLVVRWERDALGAGSWRILDTMQGPGSINADLWLSEEVPVSDTSVRTLTIVHTGRATTTVGVPDRWGLVSLPVAPGDSSVEALFPDAVSAAFSFGIAYTPEDVLSPGAGYWIRHVGAGSVPVTGAPIDRLSIPNPSGGWRLVGTIWCPIPRLGVCPSCPAPPILFGYRNGYFIPDTLLPGEAYWYRGSGTLELDCRATGLPSAPVHTASASPPPHQLELSDEAGNRATLWFADGPPSGAPGAEATLPPVPPDPIFDARFESESLVEYFTGEAASRGTGISVHNAGGTLLVRYSGNGTGPGVHVLPAYSLEITTPQGGVRTHPLRESTTVPVPNGAGLRLVRNRVGETPAAFRVTGVYPNPFNPVTTIGYELPAPATVSLRILNIAGQELDRPLADAEMPAGRHQVEYDAGRFPSGVYFFTLTARSPDPRQSGRHSGKFILLK